LADLAIQGEAARQWAYNVAWLQTKHAPAAEVASTASASKYFSTEMDVRLGNAGVEIMGLYGTLKKGSKWAPLYGKFEDKCQATLGLTIAAGTTETMYNIIAWMGLGLPRPAGQK
jgi:alkylation response protein AidB-like acyl-CoA dehydrogenase